MESQLRVEELRERHLEDDYLVLREHWEGLSGQVTAEEEGSGTDLGYCQELTGRSHLAAHHREAVRVWEETSVIGFWTRGIGC